MKDWPLCAQVGALHGIVVGFAFGSTGSCCRHLTGTELAWMVFAFAGLAILASLFVLVVIRRYVFGSVAPQIVVNAILVSLVVISILYAIGRNPWYALLGVLLGFILGAVVGALLCRLCVQRTASGVSSRR